MPSELPLHSRSSGLVEVLDRVLDKGLVIAGDIRVSLAEVELLTIRIRLLVCSLDKAQEIGLDWWRYGLEALSAMAREHNIALAVLPGEDRNDKRLDEASTLPPDDLAALLSYFREGGRENLRALLRRLAGNAGLQVPAVEPQTIPRRGGYLPGTGVGEVVKESKEASLGLAVIRTAPRRRLPNLPRS